MIFEVKNGSFAYDAQHPVLKDISFGIEKGEILSILGSNGIGKTTLLKCMLGFLQWDSGDTWFENKPRNQYKENEFWKKVAYVPQSHFQPFPCSVKDTVLMGRSAYLHLFSMPTKQDEQIAQEAMELCGITHIQDANINEISGGQMQLAYIARALCTKPEVMVLDEAETGLDYANQQIVLQLLKKLAKQNNLTVIFNTHYPDHALDIADKTLLLLQDKTAITGNTMDILTEENCKKTFGIDIHLLKCKIQGEVYHTLIPLRNKE